MINVPLIWVKGCGVPPKPPTAEKKALRGEDKELVEKALQGEWIPAQELEELNEDRFKRGQPYLVIHPRKYEDEKEELSTLRRRAKGDYLYHRNKTKEYLQFINTHEDLNSVCDQVNQSMSAADEEEVKQIGKEMGEWFANYLADSGYAPHTDSVMIKQAILSAFPVINKEKKLTPENVEEVLLNTERSYNRLIEMEGYDESKGIQSVMGVLSRASGAIYQQNI